MSMPLYKIPDWLLRAVVQPTCDSEYDLFTPVSPARFYRSSSGKRRKYWIRASDGDFISLAASAFKLHLKIDGVGVDDVTEVDFAGPLPGFPVGAYEFREWDRADVPRLILVTETTNPQLAMRFFVEEVIRFYRRSDKVRLPKLRPEHVQWLAHAAERAAGQPRTAFL
jgi:hypothetical protein